MSSHGPPLLPRMMLFDIAFAIDRNRDLLRRLLNEHVTDDTRQRLAEKLLAQLELSGII